MRLNGGQGCRTNQDSKSKTCEDKKDVCLTSGGLVDDEVQ